MEKFSGIKVNRQFSKSKIQPTYKCEKCKDRGFYFEGDLAVTCVCQRSNLLTLKRKKAGITPHLMKQTFDAFDISLFSDEKRGKNKLTFRENAKRVLDAAKGFSLDVVEGKGPSGLLFLGGVGSGKTYLAAALANDLVNRGVAVRFIVVPDFLDLIRDSFNDNSPYRESTLMQEVKTAPVLVLDDLGAHNYTEWSVKIIFAILNYRLNYELPTIVTTNLEQEQIEALLGSRVYSRLMEMCRFFRLENAGDLREEKRIREARKSERI
jgi:DNA replication protein DnaC